MRLVVADVERCVGCQCCMFACVRRQNEAGLARTCLEVRSVGGMERGFIVVVCRACADPPCVKVCPTGALQPHKDRGVRLDMEKCIGCGYCVEACLIGAIFWDDELNKPMICIHCGYCVPYCPHQVFKMEGEGALQHAGR